ncbi:MAG: hypothetical protein P4L90_08825, partial [Rhodopila sp.]|nr:hypothetical protein [Rhodopila sp.]
MPPPRRPKLTEQDRRDWASFARQIALLPGRELADLPPEPTASLAPPTPRPTEPPVRRSPSILPSALSVGAHPGGLDNGTWNRFRS